MDPGGSGLVFVGMSHGTTAIRVAIQGGDGPSKAETFELLKADAPIEFMAFLKDKVDLKDIEMVAVAYSMGDAITSITPIEGLEDRGVVSLEGIGPMTGIGTKMFDEVRASGLPAVALPGLHRDCQWLDPRFTMLQSHVASPKKLAASFHCYKELSKEGSIHDAVIANISSNTVTLMIRDGKVVGGMDASLGAPGLRHGPLDVAAIRKVDSGEITANDAFSTGGILCPPYETPEKLFDAYAKGDNEAWLRLETLIIAVVMEISGLMTVAEGVDVVAITGALAEVRSPLDLGEVISRYLRTDVKVFSRFSDALGAVEIARLVHEGADEIIGVPVDRENDRFTWYRTRRTPCLSDPLIPPTSSMCPF